MLVKDEVGAGGEGAGVWPDDLAGLSGRQSPPNPAGAPSDPGTTRTEPNETRPNHTQLVIVFYSSET